MAPVNSDMDLTCTVVQAVRDVKQLTMLLSVSSRGLMKLHAVLSVVSSKPFSFAGFVCTADKTCYTRRNLS